MISTKNLGTPKVWEGSNNQFNPNTKITVLYFFTIYYRGCAYLGDMFTGTSPEISNDGFPIASTLKKKITSEKKAKNSKISRKSMQKSNNWVNFRYKSDLK